MKKMIFSFALLLFGVNIFAQTDTIILKNGKKISGKITLGDDGVWIRDAAKDLKQFSADEIQTILFCDRKPSKNCNCDEEKAATATVVFTCNLCGGEGSLKIKGGSANNKFNSTYAFTMDKGELFVEQTEQLEPGTYSWIYEDSKRNHAKGSFTLTKGQEKKIILFEKE